MASAATSSVAHCGQARLTSGRPEPRDSSATRPTSAKQHVQAEPERQVEDDADDGGGDCRQAAESVALSRSFSMNGAPAKIQMKLGTKVAHATSDGAEQAAQPAAP
jgi:hypothetical protein